MTDLKTLMDEMHLNPQELSPEELDAVSGGFSASFTFSVLVKLLHNGCGNQKEYDAVKAVFQLLAPVRMNDKDFQAVDSYFQGLLNTKGKIINDDAEMIMGKHTADGVLHM